MNRSIKSCFAGIVFILLVSILLGGCRSSPGSYILTGRVISKQPATGQMIIDNDDIPGFMPAMTMPYTVKDPAGSERVKPADIIRADVVVGPEGKFWLENVVVTGKVAAKSIAEGAAPQMLMIGDKVPDVPMINQEGKTVRFSQFKGKLVLLTFIYTRCPFPDYCPLITRHFASIQQELAKNAEEFQGTHR